MRFLLVDRIVAFEPDRQLVAIKNVSLESQYLEHHFPGRPVFPGVLIIEAMAVASGYFITRSIEEKEDGRCTFAMMTATNTRFIKAVRPGDQLRIEVELERREYNGARTRVIAQVDGEIASRGDFTFALVDAGDEDDELVQHFRMLKRVLERREGFP